LGELGPVDVDDGRAVRVGRRGEQLGDLVTDRLIAVLQEPLPADGVDLADRDLLLAQGLYELACPQRVGEQYVKRLAAQGRREAGPFLEEKARHARVVATPQGHDARP